MKKLLIVSTDQHLLNALNTDLTQWDYNVQTLQKPDLLFNKLNSFNPDLLIIDFILNDLNGGTLCHQIKCDPKLHNLPVIILSDYPELGRFSNKFGCEAILKKPLQMYDLINAVLKVIKESENSLDSQITD
jgi:DNA-binding response OmpR family regulator